MIAQHRLGKVAIVGLSGKIGSGKTTLMNHIKVAYPGAHVLNFGDALKSTVAHYLGIDVSLLYTQAGKDTYLSDYNMTTGTLLQQFGTVLHAINPLFWVLPVKRAVERCIQEHTDTNEPLVIIVGDVRFIKEATWLNSTAGCVIRLDGDPGGVNATTTRDTTHISETELDNYDKFTLRINTDTTDVAETTRTALALIASLLE